jgi:hypothetical protein
MHRRARLSGRGETGRGFFLHGLTASGGSAVPDPLPGRGHAAAAHPTRAEAVAFARRPGTFALVIDCATGETRHRLTPPEGRSSTAMAPIRRMALC